MKSNIRKINGWKFILFASTLIAFSIGSMFSITLVGFGYFILIISSLLIINYFLNNIFIGKDRERPDKRGFGFGVVGMILLVLFLGIQSPQIPFKTFILICGVIFAVAGMIKLMKIR